MNKSLLTHYEIINNKYYLQLEYDPEIIIGNVVLAGGVADIAISEFQQQQPMDIPALGTASVQSSGAHDTSIIITTIFNKELSKPTANPIYQSIRGIDFLADLYSLIQLAKAFPIVPIYSHKIKKMFDVVPDNEDLLGDDGNMFFQAIQSINIETLKGQPESYKVTINLLPTHIVDPEDDTIKIRFRDATQKTLETYKFFLSNEIKTEILNIRLQLVKDLPEQNKIKISIDKDYIYKMLYNKLISDFGEIMNLEDYVPTKVNRKTFLKIITELKEKLNNALLNSNALETIDTYIKLQSNIENIQTAEVNLDLNTTNVQPIEYSFNYSNVFSTQFFESSKKPFRQYLGTNGIKGNITLQFDVSDDYIQMDTIQEIILLKRSQEELVNKYKNYIFTVPFKIEGILETFGIKLLYTTNIDVKFVEDSTTQFVLNMPFYAIDELDFITFQQKIDSIEAEVERILNKSQLFESVSFYNFVKGKGELTNKDFLEIFLKDDSLMKEYENLEIGHQKEFLELFETGNQLLENEKINYSKFIAKLNIYNKMFVEILSYIPTMQYQMDKAYIIHNLKKGGFANKAFTILDMLKDPAYSTLPTYAKKTADMFYEYIPNDYEWLVNSNLDNALTKNFNSTNIKNIGSLIQTLTVDNIIFGNQDLQNTLTSLYRDFEYQFIVNNSDLAQQYIAHTLQNVFQKKYPNTTFKIFDRLQTTLFITESENLSDIIDIFRKYQKASSQVDIMTQFDDFQFEDVLEIEQIKKVYKIMYIQIFYQIAFNNIKQVQLDVANTISQQGTLLDKILNILTYIINIPKLMVHLISKQLDKDMNDIYLKIIKNLNKEQSELQKFLYKNFNTIVPSDVQDEIQNQFATLIQNYSDDLDIKLSLDDKLRETYKIQTVFALNFQNVLKEIFVNHNSPIFAELIRYQQPYTSQIDKLQNYYLILKDSLINSLSYLQNDQYTKNYTLKGYPIIQFNEYYIQQMYNEQAQNEIESNIISDVQNKHSQIIQWLNSFTIAPKITELSQEEKQAYINYFSMLSSNNSKYDKIIQNQEFAEMSELQIKKLYNVDTTEYTKHDVELLFLSAQMSDPDNVTFPSATGITNKIEAYFNQNNQLYNLRTNEDMKSKIEQIDNELRNLLKKSEQEQNSIISSKETEVKKLIIDLYNDPVYKTTSKVNYIISNFNKAINNKINIPLSLTGVYLTSYMIQQATQKYTLLQKLQPKQQLLIIFRNGVDKSIFVYPQVLNLQVTREQDNPVDTAVITIPKLQGLNDNTINIFDKDTNYLPLTLLLQPGVDIEVRIGYSKKVNQLDKIFAGYIRTTQDNGAQQTIIAEGYGSVLVRPLFKKSSHSFQFFTEPRKLIVKQLTEVKSEPLGYKENNYEDFIQKIISKDYYQLQSDDKIFLGQMTLQEFAENLYYPSKYWTGLRSNNATTKTYFSNFEMHFANYTIKPGYSAWDVISDQVSMSQDFIQQVEPIEPQGQARLFFGKPLWQFKYKQQDIINRYITKIDLEKQLIEAKEVAEKVYKSIDNQYKNIKNLIDDETLIKKMLYIQLYMVDKYYLTNPKPFKNISNFLNTNTKPINLIDPNDAKPKNIIETLIEIKNNIDLFKTVNWSELFPTDKTRYLNNDIFMFFANEFESKLSFDYMKIIKIDFTIEEFIQYMLLFIKENENEFKEYVVDYTEYIEILELMSELIAFHKKYYGTNKSCFVSEFRKHKNIINNIYNFLYYKIQDREDLDIIENYLLISIYSAFTHILNDYNGFRLKIDYREDYILKELTDLMAIYKNEYAPNNIMVNQIIQVANPEYLNKKLDEFKRKRSKYLFVGNFRYGNAIYDLMSEDFIDYLKTQVNMQYEISQITQQKFNTPESLYDEQITYGDSGKFLFTSNLNVVEDIISLINSKTNPHILEHLRPSYDLYDLTFKIKDLYNRNFPDFRWYAGSVTISDTIDIISAPQIISSFKEILILYAQLYYAVNYLQEKIITDNLDKTLLEYQKTIIAQYYYSILQNDTQGILKTLLNKVAETTYQQYQDNITKTFETDEYYLIDAKEMKSWINYVYKEHMQIQENEMYLFKENLEILYNYLTYGFIINDYDDIEGNTDDKKIQQLYNKLTIFKQEEHFKHSRKLFNFQERGILDELDVKLYPEGTKPFSNFHLIDDKQIIKNNISLNDNIANDVVVYSPTFMEQFNFGKPITRALESLLPIITPNYEVIDGKHMTIVEQIFDEDIPQEYRNTMTVTTNFGNIPQVRILVQAYYLKKSLEQMYNGEIVIIGKTNVKPYDIVFIQDTNRMMFGTQYVKQVTHIYSPDTGYVTSIKIMPMIHLKDLHQQALTYTILNIANYTLGTLLTLVTLGTGNLLLGALKAPGNIFKSLQTKGVQKSTKATINFGKNALTKVIVQENLQLSKKLKQMLATKLFTKHFANFQSIYGLGSRLFNDQDGDKPQEISVDRVVNPLHISVLTHYGQPYVQGLKGSYYDKITLMDSIKNANAAQKIFLNGTKSIAQKVFDLKDNFIDYQLNLIFNSDEQ